VSFGNLAGLRVLDLTIWRPGPYATQLLAEQGADVLKVEPPGGDPMRSMPDLFDILGAHKRSIELDLKTDEGRERCLELAEGCDVFVESYRPGVADRLGVGYEAVRARNPAVVYASVTGFGAMGDFALVPGHDVNYLATTGVLQPDVRRPPQQPTVPLGDLGGGIAGAFAIVTAVLGARATGVGERVDVSITDVLSTWVGPVAEVRMVGVDRVLAGVPGYGVFPTADDRHVAIGIMNEDHFWVGLCRALDLPHEALSNNERNSRVHELNAEIAKVIAGLTEADALERLSTHDVPAVPVLDRDAMLHHPHFRQRGVVVERPDGRPTSGPMVRFEARPGRAPYGAPPAGADEPGGWLPR
jgi:crotonobetainyl-CoA:carnitine CoA-transferase CaiB-like acyl-CoA transferase